MKIREVICASTAPVTASLGTGTVTIHDLQTGAHLVSFKQTSAAANSTSVILGNTQMGGLVLTAQPEKAILNVYAFQKVWRRDGDLLSSYNNIIPGANTPSHRPP